MKLASKIFRRTNWYVTSPFGYRKDPFGSGATVMHNGTDYGTNGQKWAQYAIEDGTILSAGKASDGALFVWVNYPRINRKLLLYHLDSLSCKTGDKVKEGTLLGYTGTTGNSTGIHLHLGMQVSSGGSWLDPHAYEYSEPVVNPSPSPTPTKTIDELANEVIKGLWGNGDERKTKLSNSGYDYTAVQKRVNEILNSDLSVNNPAPNPTPTPDNNLLDLVRKTIRGDYGNGANRQKALGTNYAEVQRQVNLNLKDGRTRWDNIKIF